MKMSLILAAIGLSIASPAAARCHASPDVVMYVTDWCPYCANLQKSLKRRGIRFRTCDIEKSDYCAENLLLMTGGSTIPTTIVCNQDIVGDDPDGVEAAVREHLRTTHPDDLDY